MKNRYYICMLLVLAICGLVLPASAATSIGTAVISSNPGEGIDLCVMGGISDWTLAIGDNVDSQSVNMSIASNDAWIVYTRDSLDGGKFSGTSGYMSEFDPVAGTYVVGGYNLTNPINVRSGLLPYVALSGTNQQIQSGTVTPAEGNLYDLSFKQHVVFADPRLYGGHFYRTVVTFVGQNT